VSLEYLGYLRVTTTANPQFWLHSCTHKLSPHAMQLHCQNREDAVSSSQNKSQGSISMNKVLGKIGKGGKFWFSFRFLFSSSVPLC
jgi:hypothetical protein